MPKLLGRKEATVGGEQSLVTKGENSIPSPQKDIFECHYVIADNANQTEDDILNTTGVPKRGNILRGGLIQNVRAKEVATVVHPTTGVMTILWEIEVTGDSSVQGDDSQSGDPTDWRPKRRWYGEIEKERMMFDADGKPLVTQAGEEIIYEDEVVYAILEISRYETWPFDNSKIETYVDTSNLEDFYGRREGTGLMLPMETEEEVINGAKFERVTYKMKFKRHNPQSPNYDDKDTWVDLRLLHQGYLYYDKPPFVATVRPTVFVDKSGQPVKVNLRTHDPVNSGNATEWPAQLLDPGDDPNYLLFARKKKVSWQPLHLEY